MDKKDTFVLHAKYLTQVEKLDMGQRGMLFTAILSFASGKEIPQMDPVTEMLYCVIEEQLKEDFEKYQKTCEARKNAGKRGGIAKNEKQNVAKLANASKAKQSLANLHDSDSECDSDNDINKKTMCKADADALFERLWKMYPNKRGKGQVSDADKRHLLDIGFDEMNRVIERYKADLALEDWRKPQNGSTFFHKGYIDYLDSNYTPQEPKKAKKTNTTKFNNFTQRDYDYDELERQLLNSNPAH